MPESSASGLRYVFRIFRSTALWNMCSDRNLTDLDRMHTGIDKAWSTERDSMQQCFCSAVQLGVAVFMQNIGLDGQKATVWSCWHSVLFYLCCAHWTDLRSLHWHSQAQSTGREMLQAARHTKYLQCLQYQLCCTSLHGAFTLTLDYSRRKRMFERCRQATQQSTCKKETRRACGAGLSVSEELAMLGLHSQLAETQCMIQLYLQQQSSATC
jgi:hypothetical protein